MDIKKLIEINNSTQAIYYLSYQHIENLGYIVEVHYSNTILADSYDLLFFDSEDVNIDEFYEKVKVSIVVLMRREESILLDLIENIRMGC